MNENIKENINRIQEEDIAEIREIIQKTIAESIQKNIGKTIGADMQEAKTNIHCCFIKDILPLYLDDMVSEETSALIKEHLSHCEGCKKEFDLLTQDVALSDNVSTRLEEAKPLKLFQRRMKKRKIVICAILSIMLLVTFTALSNPAVIRKGNPIPYICAMLDLNHHSVPFVKLNMNEGRYDIYMTKQRESGAMIQHIEAELGMKFEDQSGSSCIFSNGTESILVETERYFGNYTLWKVFNKDISIP